MLIYSIISLIISNAVINRRDSSILYSRSSIYILISSLLILYINYDNLYLYNGLILYNGLLCLEIHILVFIMVILFLTTIIISINSVFILKNINKDVRNNDFINNIIKNNMSEQYRIIEYPLIILFCIIGAIFLMLSFDIISIFLSIELQSYALYLICSIYRNSESSISAGLTYFLLGGLSSCLILLGISLLYMNSGNTSLENIYIINNISDIYTYDLIYNYTLLETINNIQALTSINTQYIYLQISLVIMSIGFLFKISAAPFHF